MLYYNYSLSLSNNSIYGIHFSYYSFLIGFCLSLLLLLLWSMLQSLTLIFKPFSLFFIINSSYFNSVLYSCVFIGFILLLLLLWLIMLIWLNDLWIESFISLSYLEQFSLIIGIKLLIVSEFMLFFACFWSLINFRFITNAFSLFYSFPLLSSYSFQYLFLIFLYFFYLVFLYKPLKYLLRLVLLKRLFLVLVNY